MTIDQALEDLESKLNNIELNTKDLVNAARNCANCVNFGERKDYENCYFVHLACNQNPDTLTKACERHKYPWEVKR